MKQFSFPIFCGLSIALSLFSISVGSAAEFPEIYNSEQDKSATPPTPEESLRKLTLPPGFQATVFAAEPDVQNPIAMAWDSRGRLWIAENYTYAERSKRFDVHLRDRILVLEDVDGDGRFDSRRVFTDDVQLLTSVEVSGGGIWAMCPPRLLFFPDRNRDDVPDEAPQVVLDGFNVPDVNYHNFANGLHWGPDGWLYGRCGASAPGEIGIPGTPAEDRKPLRGGVWRYHSQRKTVEVLNSGPMNPWGHDWNEHGELFFINTVNGHLWHLLPGAHFQSPHTRNPNPRVYTMIDTHADHWHFDIAKGWTNSRHGAANEYGGGHAHVGAMVYLGDNWPKEFRGQLCTLNLFGRRVNRDNLERLGAGYVGTHGGDSFIFNDDWFRGMELGYGPDGGVFVLDWSDTGECHETTGVHRTSGRIYKIVHGKPEPAKFVDLANQSDGELVKLHLHPNEWYVRQARRQLADRAAEGRDMGSAVKQLRNLFAQQSDPVVQLRALWSLYAIGGADETFLRAQLQRSNEHVRVWAIRLLTDFWPLDTVMSERPTNDAASRDIDEFCAMAKSDPSGLVCLSLATVLQRLPVSQRPQLAAPLLERSEYADDHNLPLMVWYGLIPIGDSYPSALANLAVECELPLVRKFIARRLGEEIERQPKPLNHLLSAAMEKPESFQSDLLCGLSDSWRGWRKVARPAAWNAFQTSVAESTNGDLRNQIRDLNALFGDGRALDELERTALDNSKEIPERQAALESLIETRSPNLRKICEKLLGVRFLNSTAVRGLASFDDPDIGKALAANYESFHPFDRPAVMAALTSRPSFSAALLGAMADGKIARSDLTPFGARQIRSFNDPQLTARLAKVWGEVRDSPAEKQELIATWKEKLTPAAVAAGDKSRGRVVFNKSCATCHSLYGHGDRAGLDLTGSGRDNLDYLLGNIVDPSAVVNADFRMKVVQLADGRTLNGIVTADSERTIVLKTAQETIVIDRADIDELHDSTLSLMPEGMLETLQESQVRDLIAYLMHASQVPLPVEP